MSIKNTNILIFGGSGSLGKTLVKRFILNNRVCVYSRDESKHWTMKNENNHSNLSFVVGDIRDKSRAREAIIDFKPDHIILASALKHVDVCERSPSESILTNVNGIQNVISLIKENYRNFDFIKTVCMVSTDKACSPINVYGMSKALSERIVTSCKTDNDIKFVAVRYGNVLESRGSIIPLFKYQAENKDEITVTHKDMTRYVMTLSDSVDLIEQAITIGKSGETWIPSLPSMKIYDLAEIFSEINDKPIRVIGMRPGEKIHEDLINEAESLRTIKNGQYFIIYPSYTQPFNKGIFSMRSDTSLMTKEELRTHLENLEILQKPLSQFVGKKIEDIRKD